MMNRKPVISLLLLAALCACNPAALTPGPERPAVGVDLSLSIAPLEDAGPGTKTDYEPDYWSSIADAGERAAAVAASVKTVLLLQFEWADASASDALLIGQHFVSDWATQKPVLLPSDKKNTILVIANVPGKLPLPFGTTLGAFLESRNYNLIDGLDDLSGRGVWYSPNGGTDRYLRMSCAVEKNSIAQDESISANLKLNCAKVVVKVTNTSPASEKIAIDEVRLGGINRKYYYVTNMDGFADVFSVRTPYRFEEGDTFPAAYNDSGDAQTYTFYVPANLRGVHASSTSAQSKNDYAPRGATYFRILGTRGTTPVVHTYYLGGNLTDDYNLAPNHKYTFDFKVRTPGDAAHDSRVEDLSEVTFSTDAICYILQPPALAGQSRTYAIPVRRAAVFWNPNNVDQGLYGASGGDNEVFTLSEDTPWTASVEWAEFAGDFDADTLSASGFLQGQGGCRNVGQCIRIGQECCRRDPVELAPLGDGLRSGRADGARGGEVSLLRAGRRDPSLQRRDPLGGRQGLRRRFHDGPQPGSPGFREPVYAGHLWLPVSIRTERSFHVGFENDGCRQLDDAES